MGVRLGIDRVGPRHAAGTSRAELVVAAVAGAMIVFAAFGYHLSAARAGDEVASYRTGPVAVGGAFAGPSDGGTLVLTSSTQARSSGAIQTVEIDASDGRFVPNHIRVRAGVPVEMRFSTGAGGARVIRIADLGISADLSGGVSVRLPALAPGVYPFSGGTGTVSGVIVAE